MSRRSTASLLFSSLFFTLLQPGIVAGLIPYWLLRQAIRSTFSFHWGWTQFLGIFLFTTGLLLLLDCVLRFALTGRGTLSPADPTKKLVIRGWYQYSRNPMYIGVMGMLTGEALFYQVVWFWWYVALIGLLFNLFIILVEEPRLKKDFGDEYLTYRKSVRRWL